MRNPFRRRPKKFYYPYGIPRVDKPGTVRLWDKEFNLIATFNSDEPLSMTVDKGGQRWSGPAVWSGGETLVGIDDYGHPVYVRDESIEDKADRYRER